MQELFKTYIRKTMPFKNYLKKLRYQKISQISKFLIIVIYKNTREIYTFYIEVIIFYIIVLFFIFKNKK